MEQQLEEAPDKLQVKVTYKIQLKNQSVGKITGYVTDLADYMTLLMNILDHMTKTKKKLHGNKVKIYLVLEKHIIQ